MIKMNVSTKIDMSGLKALQRELKRKTLNVGYIDSRDHWMNEGVPVAQIASHLHYWSPWAGTFMLSEKNTEQMNAILKSESGGLVRGVDVLLHRIGKKAVAQIADNIRNVQVPANSKEWEEIKGFNDPLVFGSKVGESPNLISELTYKLGDV